MKALTLTQPWATLVAIGAKAVETRSWRTPYRGPLAIHAAKRWTDDDRDVCWEPVFRRVLDAAGLVDYTPYSDLDTTSQERFDALPLGAIVALARLVDVVPAHDHVERLGPQERAFGDYAPGRAAWLLADVRPLPTPLPCPGARGLWAVPPEIAAWAEERVR